MKRPRLLFADDHAMLVAGLCRIVEPEFEVAGTASDGRELLERAESLKPDVVVADISMPLCNGLEATRELSKRGVTAKVIILTMHGDVTMATEALEAGASGYLLKQSAAEELLTAIREVLKGRTYVTPAIAGGLLDALLHGRSIPGKPSVKLTARERHVLQLVAEGRSTKEVAGLLNVSTRTVEFHKYNAMGKLNLRTTAELTQYAIRHGMIGG